MTENENLNNLINLFEKLQKEYLLINRIVYKVKNQFRRQKQFQLIIHLKNILKREIFTDNQLSSIFLNMVRFYDKIDEVKDSLLTLGEIFKEMLKLKLFVNYSIIILAILR
jgi:hypothetical protein